jgi:light-harvesting complex I chlorophyll a/b binding protein 2
LIDFVGDIDRREQTLIDFVANLAAGSDPESLRWNVQAELVHCRWAMLGAAGIFIPELLTKIGILNTPSWYTAGEQEYFTDTTTLFVVELILIGWAEGRRWADIIKPGSVNTDPIFPNNKLTGTDVGYAHTHARQANQTCYSLLFN